jgi:hypothetical protein
MPKVRIFSIDESGESKLYKTVILGDKDIDHANEEEIAEFKTKLKEKAKNAFEEVLM